MSASAKWTGQPAAEPRRLVLRLYVAGHLPRAELARANLKLLCDGLGQHAPLVDIVDVFAHPQRTLLDAIVVTPTLVRLNPKPMLKILGTLSDLPRVRLALGIDAPAPPNLPAAASA